MSRHSAVISVGTNSTRVLLADVTGDVARVALARSIGTRIGEGLKERGALGEEPMQRTLEAVRNHLRAIRGHYLRLFTIATSALRRADNGEEFTARMQALTGVPVDILSGEDEAAASYRGAITVFGPLRGDEIGVVDVGGGSSEYAVGSATAPERTVSCEIGAVRLTEELPQLAGHDGAVDSKTIERARTIAGEALASLREFPTVSHLALVGGSATTAASFIRGRRMPIDAYELSRDDLARAVQRLCAMQIDERKKLAGVKPQRADILPGGIIVLETVLDLVGRDRATATTADLLLGYLLQRQDRAGRAEPRPGWSFP
jgi:exopolyphosphatase / guanosine-5'-triphosphate,3'-diphosphate pyrophosphatase